MPVSCFLRCREEADAPDMVRVVVRQHHRVHCIRGYPGGLWYFFDENGVMAASRWIRSASDPSAWYYVGPNGDMLVNTVTPDGYTVDANGVWRQ